MRIDLSPQVRAETFAVVKHGEILTINGEAFDFTGLNEGDTVESVPCPSIIGPVSRESGSLRIKLLLPCGYDAPLGRTFPSPIINPPDGQIIFPGDEA